MKRKIPTNPRTDLFLTVENLSCNKGILQDTRRYTEKETRTTLLSPQVFALFDLFPYFLEIFKNSWNLKKHTQRRHSKKVRRQNRTTVMRKVRKMLSDTELLRESTDRRVRMQPMVL